MAFWTYTADRISKEHIHDYDEYMVCLDGEYIVTINGKEIILHAEPFMPLVVKEFYKYKMLL